MLRFILAAVAFSLLCRATPIFAAQSCEDWCENRCAHRVPSQGVCMNKCVPACQQRRGQDSRVRALPQKLRQLGDIRRDAPRLILVESA
jgi:hypothetical protein